MSAAGCHVRAAPPDDPRLVARARLLRIEDTRGDEPAFVDSMLWGDDSRLRAAAALSAGRIGARVHIPALHALATASDTAAAASALFALGLLKDTSALTIAEAALRRGPTVGVEGAWLLGELGEAARPALVAALSEAGIGTAARAALLQAATRLRPVPAAQIIPFVASADSALAWRAAYALARGRSPAGVRPLIAAAASPWSAVREQAARALAQPVAGDSLGARAEATLVRLVADPDPRVRMNAVRALATYGRRAESGVLAALRDRDAGVRMSAAQSLALVLGDDERTWRDAWALDTAFAVRSAIADGAQPRGVLAAELAPWRTSAEWWRRAAAAGLDVRGSAVLALPRSRAFLLDDDGRVRSAAARALGRYADSALVRERVRQEMRGLLRDPDVGVRSAALAALARGASADDLLAALDAQVTARNDTEADARLAFWTLADSATRPGALALPTALDARLRGIPMPADPLERAAAARVPRFARWADSVRGTPREAAWYQLRAGEALTGARPVLQLETERGILTLALFVQEAPLTVHHIVELARRGYFSGVRFHRVVPNFVVQAGDPRGDGSGGPGYVIRDELNRHRYARGTLGMALAGPHTGGSQFFITHSPQPHLDGGYTVFGELVTGAEVLDRIVQGDRIARVTVR